MTFRFVQFVHFVLQFSGYIHQPSVRWEKQNVSEFLRGRRYATSLSLYITTCQLRNFLTLFDVASCQFSGGGSRLVKKDSGVTLAIIMSDQRLEVTSETRTVVFFSLFDKRIKCMPSD